VAGPVVAVPSKHVETPIVSARSARKVEQIARGATSTAHAPSAPQVAQTARGATSADLGRSAAKAARIARLAVMMRLARASTELTTARALRTIVRTSRAMIVVHSESRPSASQTEHLAPIRVEIAWSRQVRGRT